MTNPFSEPSPLPHGLPPFADIRDEHYEPAFRDGMRQQLEEVAAIAAQEAEPTFANTMEPLERSGQLLTRVATVFYNVSSSDSTDFIAELEERLAPELAAHEDRIRLDSRLYDRIRALRDRLDDERDASGAPLTDEQRYLVERWEIRMTLAGAALDETAKTRLRELNERLSVLTTRFEKDLLADTNDLAVHVTDAAELDGLAPGELSAAAGAAADRGLDGYLVTLVLPTGHPWLAAIADRDTRARILSASRSRGRRGGEHDTRESVLEIVRLRAERAALLGFASHADAVTAAVTAGTADAVAAMLGRLAPAAARNAQTEKAQLLAELPDLGELQAHDWAYASEKVRKAQYDVDTAELRPYFEAERVRRDGVFHAAHLLYGLSFTERPDLVAYHPEARVFEVADEDGTAIGLYILDLYTRDSKRGGAWMNDLVQQASLTATSTVVVNNLNVPKPADGEPTLLTYDEVTTFFHEFGHALHGLLARVTYPSFGGTAVPRDFVEFPSQVNEMWMLWPEVLTNYAVHHVTGAPMPEELVAKVRAAEQYGEGFATSEYLAAAMLDQAWHRLSPEQAAEVDDVERFQAQALADAGLDDPAVPSRYETPYFAHTFSGGYDAGYYGYIWSEVLDADTVEWFRENGGLTRENGARFRSLLLGVGGSKDPLQAYREFRGRDARIEPLLRRRGLE